MNPRTMHWLGILGLGAAGFVLMLFWPMLAGVKVAAQKSQSQEHLYHLGLGVASYEVVLHHLLSSGSTATSAPPVERHGWQSHLLPFINEHPLHSAIDFHHPWDNPVNQLPYGTHVVLFQNPGVDPFEIRSSTGESLTHYAGNSQVLPPGAPLRLSDISDGASSTLLMGEVISDFAPWGAPGNVRDPAVGLHKGAGSFGGPWHGPGTQFVFLDAKVTYISPDIDPAVLRAIATPAGGETVKYP
jgi:hypothetical protein